MTGSPEAVKMLTSQRISPISGEKPVEEALASREDGIRFLDFRELRVEVVMELELELEGKERECDGKSNNPREDREVDDSRNVMVFGDILIAIFPNSRDRL